jgi:hypothetical protein
MAEKKRRRAVYCIGSTVLLGLSLIGLFWLSEAAFRKEASYDVEVVDTPDVRGTLYTMSGQGDLLVLSIPGTSTRSGFVVNVPRKAMGLATLPWYTRLGRFALVHRETREGYCEFCAGLAADFNTGGDSTIITVIGWASDSKPPDERTKSFLRKMLVYEKRVVLKPRLSER